MLLNRPRLEPSTRFAAALATPEHLVESILWTQPVKRVAHTSVGGTTAGAEQAPSPMRYGVLRESHPLVSSIQEEARARNVPIKVVRTKIRRPHIPDAPIGDGDDAKTDGGEGADGAALPPAPPCRVVIGDEFLFAAAIREHALDFHYAEPFTDLSHLTLNVSPRGTDGTAEGGSAKCDVHLDVILEVSLLPRRFDPAAMCLFPPADAVEEFPELFVRAHTEPRSREETEQREAAYADDALMEAEDALEGMVLEDSHDEEDDGGGGGGGEGGGE